MIVLWIILGIIALLCLFVVYLLFSKTKIFVVYKDNELRAWARNGFLKWTLRPKKKKKRKKKKAPPTDEKKENEPQDISKEKITKKVKKTEESLTDTASVLWNLLREMRYRVEVVKPKIKVDFGTGDPADTGMIYGVIWAAIANVYQVFNYYLDFEYPDTEINPDFENKVFKFEFEGIIKLKLVHVIVALVRSAAQAVEQQSVHANIKDKS